MFNSSLPRAVKVLLFCALIFTATERGYSADMYETCLVDARAALDRWSPKAFGDQATVRGPLSIAAIEQEALASSATCIDCPQKPFGYQHSEWQQFKSSIRDGDCIVFFHSNPASWRGLYGSEGYALIRNGSVYRTILTRMN
jgi:hypothetical protein